LKPETEEFLERARDDLADAKKIAAIPLPKVAARSAYFAAFHAAEAFIYELTGKVVKTHSGVRSEFSRLRKGFPGAEKWLSKFLGEAYIYKEISDYPSGKRVAASQVEADEAIETAARFVDRIVELLET
jgi:uncharacterized protein (UPF0332 family)